MCVNSAKVNSSVFSATQNYEYFYTTAIIALCTRNTFSILLYLHIIVPNKNYIHHDYWLVFTVKQQFC